MFNELCCICDSYVYKPTDFRLRIKFRDVVGSDLDFDKNLCHICDHLVNKFAIFKSICSNRASDNEEVCVSKAIKLQIGNVNLFTACSEAECKDDETKQSQILDIKYGEQIEEHTKEDNIGLCNVSDVETEDNFVEDNYQSPIITGFVDEKIEDVVDGDSIHWSNNNTSREKDMPECVDNIKVKLKKKKKSFTKIILTYNEQKAVLERQRREKKYLDAIFKCYSCALGFLFKDSYQSHMVRHEESNGQYCCDVCNLRFATQNLKYMHMILHTERYRCNKCRQTIKRTHRRRHMNECWHGCKNAVSCQSCTKVFKDPDALHQHIKRFHTTELIKTYSCNVCGQIYNNQRAVRTHMIKHVNHRFECDVCQSTFASPYTLQRHKKSHTQPDPAYCTTCDKWYKSGRLYKEHLSVSVKHRQYRNPLLEAPSNGFPQATCRPASDLRTGFTTVNPYPTSNYTKRHAASSCHLRCTVLGIRFGCPVCGRALPSRRALAAHAAEAHAHDGPYANACALPDHEPRTRPRPRPHQRAKASPASRALCHHCGNTYSTKSKLRRHLKGVCERNDPQEFCLQ